MSALRTGLIAVAFLAAVFGATAPAFAQIEIRLNRVESFIPEFPKKREMNALFRPELKQIIGKAHRRMEGGENLLCSAQIYEEIHWLVNYTDRTDDVRRRMEDLRKSLTMEDQHFASKQDPKDGSFAPCMENWLWRFFRSVDPLKELAREGKKPEVPLKIWEPIDTPEEIKALMKDLLISDLDSGHNKRKELNLAITALGQLLWLDYTDSVFPEHLDRKALGDALWEFVDQEWQDTDTGYWGAWYRDGEEILRTQDLSITFHIVSYRDGDVNRLKEMGTTTSALRDVKYPFGWDTGGTQNNHHAYDVARIFNITWEHLSDVGRSQASPSLFIMAARSLAMSIDSEGRFDPTPYTTVAEAYYFGISFFDEIGLFSSEPRRTNLIELRNTENLYDQIEKNLSELDPSDPWVAAARRKLEGIKR